MTTTPALTKLSLVDIQFTSQYDATKMQQLVQALVTAETTINALMGNIQTLQTQINDNTTSTAKHVLATETGLGAEHTVSGLSAGDVLVATGPTSARFEKLPLQDLADMDVATFSAAQNGYVLGLTNGYFGMIDITEQQNPVNQTYLTMNPEEATLPNSRQLVAGTNVALDMTTPGELIVNVTEGLSGSADIDGGAANSVYLILQDLDGGVAYEVFAGPPIDGGQA